MRVTSLILITIGLCLLSGCVEPKRFVSLENRVAAIEMENNRQRTKQTASSNQSQQKFQQELDILEKKLQESASPEEYAEIKYSIQTMKENIQRIEGLIEEINYRFEEYSQKDKEELEKRIDRLDLAISKNYEKVIKLEKYMGFEPSAAGDTAQKIEPSQDPGKNPEKELYDFAKKLFDDGDRENARIQFENFINKYPDSDNADNARFWIADTYYSEKWFEKAILEYQKVLEEYPDSNKLAAARLKQGYAFAELGEKANARLILKELLKKHPGSNEAKYAQEKLKNLK